MKMSGTFWIHQLHAHKPTKIHTNSSGKLIQLRYIKPCSPASQKLKQQDPNDIKNKLSEDLHSTAFAIRSEAATRESSKWEDKLKFDEEVPPLQNGLSLHLLLPLPLLLYLIYIVV